MEGSSNRREAERELANRERRPQKLDIQQRWQQQFVDHPGEAIAEADQLLTRVMSDRGYPTDGGYEEQANDLSVEHARTRRTTVHYRTVFDDLLETHEAATARNRSDEGNR